MTPHRITPGPITWCGIVAVTCLLLFLFQKVLWLVVPFLLALVLYYLLEPLAKRMVLGGFSHNAAAATLSGAFLLVLAGMLLKLYPLVLANADGLQATLTHYLSGGYTLIDGLLGTIEQNLSFAKKAHMANSVRESILSMQEHFAEDHLADILLTLAAWLPSLLLVPVITYFMLKEGGQFRRFLGQAVPNAFFEKTLFLSHAINRAARMYFVGLIKLTLLDILMLTLGLWALGIPSPILLGLVAGLLGQIPYLGPLAGGLMVFLIAGTDFPDNTAMAYGVIALFATIRLLDDLVFIPVIVGKSLRLHPLLSLLMLLIGGTIADVAGLMLALPILGIVMLLGETLEFILTDPRLRARHAFALQLQDRAAQRDLNPQEP